MFTRYSRYDTDRNLKEALVIALFFSVILHSFFSFFHRALSIALIVFAVISLLSMFPHCYRLMTLMISRQYPFIVIFILFFIHSLSYETKT